MGKKSAKRVTNFLGTSAMTRPLFMLGAASVLLGTGPAHALDANTLPQNPNVVGGKDGFSQSGNTLNVNQSTKRTVIDWRSFDIGSKAQVNFNQPGTSSIAVNRVNASANASQIEGGLHANGQVWILNPNGVFFGKTAHVDAAGVVASTANIDANAFMAGSNKLQMTGADHGSVENQGNITVGANGLAAFVAPSVRNSGTINATVGRVALAAGTTYTLDLAGDHLVELGLGSVKAVVDNSGKIVNPGGTIALTAKAAGQVVNSVVNVSGVVSASSVTKSGGTITLGGDNVTTTSTAQLSADAGTNGNGGAITSVANVQGNYAGSFSAKGGSASGNGGSVETSGKSVHVDDGIKINTLASNGLTGSWTVDPDTLTVNDTGTGSITGGANDENETISASTVVNALNTANVRLQADTEIDVNSAINASGNSAAHNLTLGDQDGGGLTVNLNAPITLKSGGVLSGEATVVNVGGTGLIQNGIDAALTNATVNILAGTYAGGATVNKAGLTIDGAAGAKINVTSGSGLTITANNVTVENLEIQGPISADYEDVDWSLSGSTGTGIAVTGSPSSFNISDNDIHDIRTGIAVLGNSTSGSITGNTVENTKGGIIIQYSDGTGYTISGNHEGTVGNEWGIVLNTNTPGINTGGAAPTSAQNNLLALSNTNSGMSALDRHYSSSNRTEVTVDASSTATAADDGGFGNGLGNARQPLNNIQAGVDAVVSGGVVNVLNGVYTVLSGTYINITKSLSLIGQSESGVTIDARNASTYGLRVSGPNSNVDLENFTLYGSSNYGLKAENTSNLALANITSRGAGKSEFDLNGILGGTLTNLTADGAPVSDAGDTTTTAGNGIGITDSQNVTLTGVVTRNNAWGGLALYQTNSPSGYPYQETGIVVGGSNTFNEANGIYAQNQSSTNQFGTIDLTGQGIGYIAQANIGYVSPTDTNEGTYTYFQQTKQGAIDAGVGLNTKFSRTSAAVQGYGADGVSGNNQFYVGTSGGTALSIQAAVNAAAAGATINVGDGTYTGDVTIAKSGIKLLSENGSGATTIQGVAGTSAEGTIFLTPGSNNTQIGNIGHGFTIVGFDSANPAQENAAVYVQGANSGSSLIGNHITANGDEAILTEYNAAVTNLTIDHNLIDGQTFTGTNAASGDQFSVPNVSRGLVYISGGSGVTNTKNITFTNNDVSGVTGGPNGNSNYLVTIDAVGADISGNTFAGTVTGTSAQLRTRGTATNITGNIFDDANLGSSANAVEILNQSFTGADASDDTFAEVMATNTFNNRSVWLDHSLGGSWYVGTSINNAVGVATAGDTVHVGAGTYSEAVNVNKSLTIEGANAGVNAADGTGTAPAARGAESIMSHNGLYAFSVNATDVTIDGFEFTGGNGRLIDWASASSIDGLKIENNIFNTPSGAASGGTVQLAGTGTANNVEIANNLFEGTGTSALVYVGGVANAFDGLDISGNDFVSSADNAVFQAGSTFSGLEVSGNYFGHNLTEGLNMGSLADPTISGNIFDGVQFAAMQIGTTSGGTISYNTIDGTGSGYNSGGVLYADGIDVWGGEYGTGTSNGLVIEYNTIKNFTDTTPLSASDRFAGIYLRPDAGSVTIDHNTIENNTIGLLANTATTGSSVTTNTFTNNDTHVKDLQGVFDMTALAADNILDRDVWITGGNALFGNIQTGVNASTDGDTVNVGAGTYEEQVVINNSIHLVGAGVGQTIVEAPSVFTHGVAPGSTTHNAIISVEHGDNVTISDLTVDGLGRGDPSADADHVAFDGIGFFNAGGSVDHVDITGIRDGGVGGSISGNQEGVGLIAYNIDGTPRTVTLTNSTIEDFQKTGVAFIGGNLTVDVEGNTITGAGSTGVTAQNGIELNGEPGTGNGVVTGTISSNTVTGVSYAPVSNWSSTGILLINADGTNVENNIVTGEGVGDYSNGIYVSGGTVDVTGNTVTNFGWGIEVDNAFNTSNVSVLNNTVTNNGVGMEVAYQEGDASVVNAHGNDFSNNASAIELDSADATLDATGNWWGTSDESAVQAGMSGLDVNNVNFSNFLASGTDTDVAAGFQGDFSHLIVTALGGGTDRLGEAVSEVDAGGTLTVNAGTFTLPDTLYIDKSLSLVGAGEGTTTIDGSGVSDLYAIRARADDISLSDFTVKGPAGISVYNASSVVHSASISNVTIDPISAVAGVSVAQSDGVILDHVTVDGTASGGANGIQIIDSADVALTNVHTFGNGIGLLISEEGGPIQINNISADLTNNFADDAPVVVADFSAGAPGLGSVNIQGFQYAIGNENQFGSGPGQLSNDQQNAIDNAVALGATDSFIEGWTGTGVNNVFQVGVSTGGTALSINTAVGAANAGGTINVATGTYGEDVSDAKQLAFNFGNVNVNSFTLASGSAGSTVKGNLTATGAIALNDAATVAGNLTAASFTSNGTLAMTGNINATGAAAFNGASTIDGNVTADSITDSNTLALTGNFAATHGISLGGSSAIVGNLSGGSISTSAPLTLIGNAIASGAVNLGGTTGVTGNVQGATITTTGPLTLVGNATATGDVTFGGVTSVTGNVKGGTITANNTLALNGSATASGAIALNGATTLAASLTGGSIALNGATTLTGDTTLDTSAANGAITTAAINGSTAGGQSLTIDAGSGSVSLGNLGATTRLGAVSDASKTTLTGSTYNANSFLFGGDVTLTSASTTLNTTQSSSAAGDITFQGDLFGTTDAAQSLTLHAGPGTGAASANGDITMQNAGTSAVYLGDLTVTGNNFTALTVDVGGNYNALLTGNQVFAADTLNVRGNASSVVGGDASGHIVAGGDVTIVADGDISGTISGQNVTLTGDDVNSDVTAVNSATITGNTVEGSYNADTVTLVASNNVDAAVNATDFTLSAQHGSVDGTWTTVDTDGSGVVSLNGQTTVGLANVNPNQLVVEGFVLPAGTTIGANGQLILPQGVLLGLLSPGGGKPKMILVHSVQQLGELLASGYSVIVIDLSNKDSGKPIQLASN